MIKQLFEVLIRAQGDRAANFPDWDAASNRIFRKLLIASNLLFSVLLSPTLAFAQPATKPKRVKLPKPSDFPQGIFFQDAFAEGLVGKRPARLGVPSSTAQPTSDSGNEPDKNNTGTKWSSFVSARTLEDEVKALQIAVQKSVTTPGRFSSGGYLEVRTQFTELATLFAVINAFDEQVRWKSDGAHARDAFARAAANAKVTSTQAFNDAKQRKFDLEELVRGGSLPKNKPADQENDWSVICDRGPLMKRFTGCFDDGLMKWTSSPAEFKQNAANIKREAELLRMFASILQKDGMEDSGDEEYEAYCQELLQAADDVLNAVTNDDVAAARTATSMIGKSCTRCHEDYRG